MPTDYDFQLAEDSGPRSSYGSKGCRCSIAVGFLLVILAVAIAVGVGIIVHFAGDKGDVTCNYNFEGLAVSDTNILQCAGLAAGNNRNISSSDPYPVYNTIRAARNDPQTPENVKLRTGEEFVELDWKSSAETESATFCMVEYKRANDVFALSIRIPVSNTRRTLNVTGLDRRTEYKFRLFCLYGTTRGMPTDWIHAVTRTASVTENICPGTIPNGFLEHQCVRDPLVNTCFYTCADGFMKLNFRPVHRRDTLNNYHTLECVDGVWTTGLEHVGFRLQDICVPEALNHNCPKEIPNGTLEPNCGYATDWFCEFECNGGYSEAGKTHYGYQRHTFMEGTFKGVRNEPDKLLCVNGAWKTGYEHLGLDVSGVCVLHDDSCTEPVPNMAYGNTSVYARPNGVSSTRQCKEGYHRHALARDDVPVCHSGSWVLHTTIYDASVTPATFCVSNENMGACSEVVPNGRIPKRCMKMQRDCIPKCDDGYHALVEIEMTPVVRYQVSCEGGKWLTTSKPYNGDNIFAFQMGVPCQRRFPHGKVNEKAYIRRDSDGIRSFLRYRCNDGYRPHHAVRYVECVAGTLVTWNERFGIDVSKICIPVE